MANSAHKFNNRGMHFVTYNRHNEENEFEELKRWERCKYNKLGKCDIKNGRTCIHSNGCLNLELGQFQVKLKTIHESLYENKVCAGNKNNICVLPFCESYNKNCIGYGNCKFKTDKLIISKQSLNKNLSPSEILALRKSKISLCKKQNVKNKTKNKKAKKNNDVSFSNKKIKVIQNIKNDK